MSSKMCGKVTCSSVPARASARSERLRPRSPPMSNDPRHPDFPQLSRWVARKLAAVQSVTPNSGPLQAAAREARDEFLSSASEHGAQLSSARKRVGRLAALTLLAAADHDTAAR